GSRPASAEGGPSIDPGRASGDAPAIFPGRIVARPRTQVLAPGESSRDARRSSSPRANRRVTPDAGPRPGRIVARSLGAAPLRRPFTPSLRPLAGQAVGLRQRLVSERRVRPRWGPGTTARDLPEASGQRGEGVRDAGEALVDVRLAGGVGEAHEPRRVEGGAR